MCRTTKGWPNCLQLHAPITDLSQTVIEDPLSGGHVIVPVGPSTVPTDELVAGEGFAQLLSLARSRYNVVILDTPPVGPVVDALYLAALTDLILFVVRSGSTSQTEARMALQGINNAKAPTAKVLAVLNQQERASATYKSKYDSYYFAET